MKRQTVKYYAFPPIEFDGFTVGLERISDMEEQIRALHGQHYEETETLYLADGFEPDYARYKNSEAAGQFVVFTVRQGSTMVGYLQYYVFRDMHTQNVYQGREDAFYLTPEVRGQGVAPRLLAYAEDALRQLGCKYAGMSSKAPAGGPDIGPFLEREGYRPVATYYVKNLETNDVLQRSAATA